MNINEEIERVFERVLPQPSSRTLELSEIIATSRQDIGPLPRSLVDKREVALELLNTESWIDENDLRALIGEIPPSTFIISRSVSAAPSLSIPDPTHWMEAVLVLEEGRDAVTEFLARGSRADLHSQIGTYADAVPPDHHPV